MPKKKRCHTCGEPAKYNVKGVGEYFCGKHKKEGMGVHVSDVCQYEDCVKGPCYGRPGTTTALYCAPHGKMFDGMMNIRSERCQTEGCNELASFAKKGTTKKTHCFKCKTNEMRTPNVKYCKFPGCETRATFGNSEEGASYCAKHAVKNASENVVNKTCIGTLEDGTRCKILPCFAEPGKKRSEAIYCNKHKKEGMVNVRDRDRSRKHPQPKLEKTPSEGKEEIIDDTVIVENKDDKHPEGEKISSFGSKEEELIDSVKTEEDIAKIRRHDVCKYGNCIELACYNYPGKKKPLFCATHGKEINGMVNIQSKRYEGKNCGELACFAEKNSTEKTHCSRCKTDDMWIPNAKYCTSPGCEKRATFGAKGTKTPLYCLKHADKETMENVVNKTCIEVLEDGTRCKIRPCFAEPGKKKSEAIYCNKHKKEGMVNVKDQDKKCKHSGCKKIPSFGYKGEKATHCLTHKLADMVDVVHKSELCVDCPEDNKLRVRFGPLFSRKIHCFAHKKPGEFAQNKPKCEQCNKPAYYTDFGNYPKRCEDHQTKEDKNIVEKPCVKCGLSFFIKEDRDLCDYCSDFQFKQVHKTKEIKIKEFLDENEIVYESHDRPVDSINCSKKRPDFMIDYGSFYVALEVDEHQHQGYPCDCEQTRMIQIHQDVGMPLLFVRFNPDAYKRNGRTMRTYNGREKKLLEILNNLRKDTKNWNHKLGVIYLYYDGFDGTAIIENIEY